MIIWTGNGRLAFAILGATVGLMYLIDVGDDQLKAAISFLIASPITAFVVKDWNKPRLVYDAESKKDVVFQPNHSVFFIPVQYLAIVYFVTSIILFIV